MSNWIDVNNKRFEIGAYYQVLDEHEGVNSAFYTYDAEDGCTSEEGYFSSIGQLLIVDGAYTHDEQYGGFINVTHYMPMPKPPVEIDEASKKFWAETAERNKSMKEISEHRKGVDWFDSCKPDDRD